MKTLGLMIGSFIKKLVWTAYQVPGMLYFRLEKRDQRLAGLVFDVFSKTKTTNVLCKLNDIVNGEEDYKKAA
jgi:hypothetical protein